MTNSKTDNPFQREKIIYQEICNSRRMQNGEIDLISNKYYWLTLLNITIITILLSVNNMINIVFFMPFFTSIAISIYGLWTIKYRRTVNLGKLLNKDVNKNEAEKLHWLNGRLKKAIQLNQKDISKKANYLKASILFTLFGMFLFVLILSLGKVLC